MIVEELPGMAWEKIPILQAVISPLKKLTLI